MAKSKYATTMQKAKSKYNKYKNAYVKDTKAKSKLTAEYQKATGSTKEKLKTKVATVTKAASSAKKKVNYYKTVYNTAKKKNATYASQQKRKQTTKNKEDSLNAAKTDKPGYWAANRPLIMPKYPGTDHSYVYIDNQSETESSSTSITSNAISPGQYVNHYTQMDPTQHQIDGFLGGSLESGTADGDVSGLKKQYDMLRRWSENGTEVELMHGQRPSNSAVITALSANFDAPRDNAVPVSITLQDTKWAATTAKKATKGSTGKKSNSKTSSSTKKSGTKSKSAKNYQYTTIKKGDTYWGFHQKFGTSVAQLEAWNGYPANKLPVGKKLRYK